MCGVVGLVVPGRQAARSLFFSLFALQHRGQESAGVAASSEGAITCYKALGQVTQVFRECHMKDLVGSVAIGHNRYSTTGGCSVQNAHPFVRRWQGGQLALAHNGNLTNADELREVCVQRKIQLRSTGDSEMIAGLLAKELQGGARIKGAVRAVMGLVRGAYSVVAMYQDTLVAFRDPYGIQPLHLGRLSGGYVVASEDCAFAPVGATPMREIAPGECVLINAQGDLSSHQLVQPNTPALCLFQAIYFARPDSHLYGRLIADTREAMGRRLAQEHPVSVDLVCAVPDSGIPGAMGYAQASGLPYVEVLTKSRYIQRTFISPDAESRAQLVRMKLSVMGERVAGKRIVLVDDSIVRGTTTGEIVRLLRDAGATEVHVRITAPPVVWPCFYGVDMSTREQLIAARLSIEAICRHIGAESLGYLSLEGAVAAAGGGDRFCTACFSGTYPISR